MNCHCRGMAVSVLVYMSLVFVFFAEDQILLSDCASSLAVQVMFCLCSHISAYVCRPISCIYLILHTSYYSPRLC